jgi:branched-chain amino acid transport system permease protein
MGSPVVKGALRAGAIAGIAVWYLALVGMLGRLADLPIIGTTLTMDQLLIFLPAMLAGWFAVRPRVVAGEIRTPSSGEAVAAGAATGFGAGIVVGLGLAAVNVIGVETVRTVFPSVSPELMNELYLGYAPVVGTVVLIIGMTALAAFAAGLRSVPAKVHRPIVAGLAAIVATALLEQVIAPAFNQMKIEKDWLYNTKAGGLEWIGAVVVFVVVAAAVWFRVGPKLRDILLPGRSTSTPAAIEPPVVAGDVPPAPGSASTEEDTSPARHPLERGLSTRGLQVIAWLVIAGILAVLPYLVGPVVARIVGSVGIFVLLGLGLNIVVGYAGLLDLGYVAFFAVGAYFTAILTGGQRVTFAGFRPPAFGAGLSFYVALPIVVLIAAFIGVLIGAPVLRLRGDYLAIVTLGFGEIARVIFGSTLAEGLFGGSLGMTNVTSAPIPGTSLSFQSDPRHFYYLVLVFCLLAIFVSWRLQASRIGRAWNAMREDEQVADAMGISTTRYKLLAFAMGGAIGSLGGALFAVSLGSLTIASFKILISITALAVVILGGLGSIPGVIVGALVLIGLPGLLSQFEDYRLLIYGATLIAVMLLRPQGLIPNVRRSRELQEDERTQDQWAKHLLEADATDAPQPSGGTIS